MLATTTHITEVGFGNYSYLTIDGESFFRGCSRCGGTGHYSFNGVDSICYKCGNIISERLGTFLGDAAAAEKDAIVRQKRVDARIRKENARVERLVRIRDEKVAALRIRDNAVAEFLLAIDLQDYDRSRSSFITAMAENVQYPAQAEKPFSDNMLAAVQRELAKRTVKAAEAAEHPVEEGRIVITGEVVSAKIHESDFGTVVKIVVKDDRGFRVYGSIQKDISEAIYNAWYERDIVEQGHSIHDFGYLYWSTDDAEILKGTRVSFTATVERSHDDEGFGFFKRPAKGTVLA